MSHWLQACCPKLDFLVASDISEFHSRQSRGLPAAIVVYASGCSQSLSWVNQQITAIRSYYKSAPAILVNDGLDPDLVQELVNCKIIDAIIPTSDTTEIAAAALRLVLAGGHYTPQLVPGGARLKNDLAGPTHNGLDLISGSDLTVRERAVLKLLETGKPNKVIAYELGMSLGTAKVHVHNIITKLKVKNRTEAVIAARTLNMQRNQLGQIASKQGQVNLEPTASQYIYQFTPSLANYSPARVPRASAKRY